jgi:hypothetical protein
MNKTDTPVRMFSIQQSCTAEVDHSNSAIRLEQDIARMNVSVQHSGFMKTGIRRDQHLNVSSSFREVRRPRPDQARDRLTFEPLNADVRVFANEIHRLNTWRVLAAMTFGVSQDVDLSTQVFADLILRSDPQILYSHQRPFSRLSLVDIGLSQIAHALEYPVTFERLARNQAAPKRPSHLRIRVDEHRPLSKLVKQGVDLVEQLSWVTLQLDALLENHFHNAPRLAKPTEKKRHVLRNSL